MRARTEWPEISATVGPERVRDPIDPFHEQFKILPCMPNLTRERTYRSCSTRSRSLVKADLIIVDTVARALGACG